MLINRIHIFLIVILFCIMAIKPDLIPDFLEEILEILFKD